MRELTPPGSSVRIAIDSQTYNIITVDYVVIGCQHCGKAKSTICLMREGRTMSEHDLFDAYLKQFPRCLCTRDRRIDTQEITNNILNMVGKRYVANGAGDQQV